jgi:hypothetical protein
VSGDQPGQHAADIIVVRWAGDQPGPVGNPHLGAAEQAIAFYEEAIGPRG